MSKRLASFTTAIVLAAVGATTALADDAPAAGWMLVTNSGRPKAIVRDGLPALNQAGLHIVTGAVEAAPKVLILYPRAIDAENELGVIREICKEGAGMVLIYSMSPDLLDITQKLLAPWDVELSPAKLGTDQIELGKSPITEGLEKPFVWRVAANLKGVDPLLTQGANVVGGTSTKGGMRLVVLPLDAVVPGEESDTIPVANLQLLAQAVQWAAGVKVGAHPEAPKPAAENSPAPAGNQPPTEPKPPAEEPGAKGAAAGEQATPAAEEPKPAEAPTVQGPVLPANAPAERGSYSRTAYIDITCTDENWPAISNAVRNVIEDAGLKTIVAPAPPKAAEKTKPPDAADLPLVKALRANPALVVMGSCREYADAEAAALATYVQSGGAVLALPRGTDKSNERMVWLNEALEKFGVAASLGRPAGTVRLDSSVITLGSLGASSVGDIPAGSLMVGYRGSDIAYVGAFSAARVETMGAGRLALVDPLPLIQAKGAAAQAWADLTTSVVRWLVFGMKLGGQ